MGERWVEMKREINLPKGLYIYILLNLCNIVAFYKTYKLSSFSHVSNKYVWISASGKWKISRFINIFMYDVIYRLLLEKDFFIIFFCFGIKVNFIRLVVYIVIKADSRHFF